MPTDDFQELKATFLEFLSLHKSVHVDALILTKMAEKHILDWGTILGEARSRPEGPAALAREQYSRLEEAVRQAGDCESLLRALRDYLPKDGPTA